MRSGRTYAGIVVALRITFCQDPVTADFFSSHPSRMTPVCTAYSDRGGSARWPSKPWEDAVAGSAEVAELADDADDAGTGALVRLL